ncbi:MAG TPA: PilZ domain-containing protein [Kofleriaceae bacterium]|nr:PilZ domain-containing protein [Kofleriaceae bacterium]
MRLALTLASESDWIKVFDPRDWTVFVAGSETARPNETVRLDLQVGDWSVTLRGLVVTMRSDPDGIVVALGPAERDKINYLNGFVRGGLLNLRTRRRLLVRLPVTYGAVDGPAKTFTKDINEEGAFLLTERPLPETSQLHMLFSIPGRTEPLSLRGTVSHVILPDDDMPAGMGVLFLLDEAQKLSVRDLIGELAAALDAGTLPSASTE